LLEAHAESTETEVMRLTIRLDAGDADESKPLNPKTLRSRGKWAKFDPLCFPSSIDMSCPRPKNRN
jgi:hypothetical protein